MNNKHKKQIKGEVVVTASIPITFEVDAWDEEYSDKYGNRYFEEEFEYGIDDVIGGSAKYPTMETKKIQFNLQTLKNNNWNIEEIRIDDYELRHLYKSKNPES